MNKPSQERSIKLSTGGRTPFKKNAFADGKSILYIIKSGYREELVRLNALPV